MQTKSDREKPGRAGHCWEGTAQPSQSREIENVRSSENVRHFSDSTKIIEVTMGDNQPVELRLFNLTVSMLEKAKDEVIAMIKEACASDELEAAARIMENKNA